MPLVLFLAPGFFPTEISAAEPPKPKVMELTLSEAVFLALRDNYSVKSAYLDRVAQKFSLEVTEDIFTPKGSISTGFERSKSDGSDARRWDVTPSVDWKIPTGAQFSFSWANIGNRGESDDLFTATGTATVTQPLLKGAGFDVNMAPIQQARNTEKINILGLRSTLSTTITSVVLAYRNLVLAAKQLEIQRFSLERSKQLIETNRVLIESGRMASQELIQAEADAASREVSLAGAENNLDAANFKLLALLALKKHTRIVPTEPREMPEVELEIGTLQQIAFANRPDFLQAELNMENLHLGKLLADNNRRWQLDLSASITNSKSAESFSPSYGGSSSNDWQVGVGMTIPFFDKSRDLAPLQAKIAMEKGELSLLDLRERIEREVLDGVRDVRIKRRQVDLASRALSLAKQKLEIEQVKLNVGRSTNFQVVQFENDLVSMQNQELSAIFEYINALNSLDETLGTALDTWEIEMVH
ncbi:MAG: TolC family protein [Desulfobacteraceae bacterium]|nr:TolC family protein [Desulfobacteraceae bacterium]